MDQSYGHILTIQQISRRLDIPKSTLRFWEKEFCGLLVPIRTNGGQRRYSPEHITITKEIKKLKIQGMSLENIKMKLSQNHQIKKEKPDLASIEYLGNTVAEVVKNEIHRFFQNRM